jgi:mannose-1-phosphate guanylyltransferase/mannose-1-phosphate guanylyltransferase/mannose-6-phosphate isomerase
MIPVILSGGSGTRLWPLSREFNPRQFLSVVSDKTMVLETLALLDGNAGLIPPSAVCNEDHRVMMAEQLLEIGCQASAIILEPVGKNTAPAVAMAALAASSEDDVLLVLPADHVIEDKLVFQKAVEQANVMAEAGYLVTFGVVPTSPETGYGYIKRGDEIREQSFNVAAFVEKPNLATAAEYVDSGDYFWNSGMFAFKAKRYLEELEKFNPEMLNSCRKAFSAAKIDLDFTRLDKEIFSDCPADSIDYAVLEKTEQAIVIPLNIGWNDVGSWSALWDVTNKDERGNAIHGDVLAIDTSNSFIHTEGRLVATIGLHDFVVIETDDAVMVAPKDRVQDVRLVVDQLKELGRKEARLHRKVYRPWGHYDSVDIGERHQTKRIVVNPGAKLSVQKHYHRAEHWVVVKGTALVTKSDEQVLLSENESIYIPLGTVHCLENPGVIPLEMVEVQSGSYLGEDDIVRYEDKYGRVEN